MQRSIVCLIVLLTAMAAAQTRASILSVDLNGARGASVGSTYSGNGVLRADGTANDNPAAGTTTGHWDGITFPTDANTPVPATGLLDSGSNPTGVTISLANWTFQDNCPGCNYAHGDPNNMPLLNDYIGAGPGALAASPTLTIGGLALNTTYNLYIYGTNGGSGAGGTWSVNGSPTQQTDGNGPNPFATFSSGHDYVLFTASTGATHQLVLTGSAGPLNGYVILNGFQLSPIPEPASLTMLGLGAISVLARRRRD